MIKLGDRKQARQVNLKGQGRGGKEKYPEVDGQGDGRRHVQETGCFLWKVVYVTDSVAWRNGLSITTKGRGGTIFSPTIAVRLTLDWTVPRAQRSY